MRSPLPPSLLFLSPGHREVGGVARHARVLAAGLSARGYELTIVTRAHTSSRLVLHREPKLRLYEIPGFHRRRLGAILFAACALWKGAFSTKPRAVLAMQLSGPTLVGAIIATLRHVPLIVMATSGGPVSEIQDALRGSFRGIRLRLIRRADFAVAQHDSQAKELEQIFEKDRVAIVPTPAEELAPRPLTRSLSACFAGRFSSEKDLLVLLDAWESVAGLLPTARLCLLGGGGAFRSVEAEIQDRIRGSRLSESVALVGWQADSRTVIERHDVFVLPSRSEGMSNALVEAVSLGRIVVASDIAANRAVVGDDYPLLFSPGDTEALSTRLISAFTDENLRLKALAVLKERLPSLGLPYVLDRVEELINAANSSRN